MSRGAKALLPLVPPLRPHLNLPAAPFRQTSWVLDSVRSGAMPCVRLGRCVRFQWGEVERWLEECKQPGRAIWPHVDDAVKAAKGRPP